MWTAYTSHGPAAATARMPKTADIRSVPLRRSSPNDQRHGQVTATAPTARISPSTTQPDLQGNHTGDEQGQVATTSISGAPVGNRGRAATRDERRTTSSVKYSPHPASSTCGHSGVPGDREVDQTEARHQPRTTRRVLRARADLGGNARTEASGRATLTTEIGDFSTVRRRLGSSPPVGCDVWFRYAGRAAGSNPSPAASGRPPVAPRSAPMSHTDDSSEPQHQHDPGRPRRGRLRLVVAGILVALLSALAGPTGPALAKPSPPEIALPSGLASPAPAGAVGHRACCSHPDPPHTPGVPYRWCVRHHTCWGAHQFVARHVKRFADWRRDGVTHRILPTRFERKVRRVFAHRGCGARCARTVEHAVCR